MKKFSAVLLLLTCVATVSFSQKPINLKFNLPKGQGFDYNVNMAVTTTGKAGGQDINVKNAMTFGYRFGVIDDSSSWKKMQGTISKIAMTISAGGENINYDSDEPVDTSDAVNSTFAKIIGALIGSQFEFIMNANGKVGYVHGINEMVEKMKGQAPSEDMASGMAGAFDEESFKQNLQQSFGLYPAKPVKPGDTWTGSTNTISNDIKLKMDNVYKLESVSGNIATVKVSSTISSPSSESITSMSGSYNGTVQFDIPTGIPTNGDIDMILNINVNAGGQTIPMATDVKMKITGKKY
jgi:hypothetical protein